MSPEAIRDRMIEAHIPFIEDAGKQGVQVLCLQEVFTQPYFCPSQDRKWYAAAEKIPDGYTTKLMQDYAKKHGMVIVVPIYEEHMTGVYLQHGGRHRRGRHLPRQVSQDAYSAGRSRVLRKVFLQAGRQWLPGFRDSVRQARGLHLLRPALPGRLESACTQWCRVHRQSIGDGSGPQQVSLGTGAAGIGRRQWGVYRRD